MRQTEFDISRLLPPTSQIRALCFLLSVLYFSRLLDWQTTAALLLSVLALSGYTAWLFVRRLVQRMRRQRAELRTDMDETPFLLCGDRFYWSQILFNLTENTIKNNPQGGVRGTVRAESAPHERTVFRISLPC